VDEKEEVSSYWTTLGKIEDAGNLKRKQYIALCGELGLEKGHVCAVGKTAGLMNKLIKKFHRVILTLKSPVVIMYTLQV
jgi:hypothetical protein